jgi:hypothetical protein
MRGAAALFILFCIGGAEAGAQEGPWRATNLSATRATGGDEIHSNLRIQREGAPLFCRATAEPERTAFNCTDGDQSVVAVGYLPVAEHWHLLAALLSPGTTEQAAALLNTELSTQALGYDTIVLPDGPVIVFRMGTTALGLAVDAETSLLRQVRWQNERGQFEMTVVSRSDDSNGWYPAELLIRANGRTWGSVSVTDVADNERDLALLQQADMLIVPADALRFPRLPL